MRVQGRSEDYQEDAIVAAARAIWRKTRQGWRQIRVWVDEALECRQCGQRAGPWDRVCKHCGSGNPVKIGVSPHLMLTAVACEMILLYLNFRPG